MHKPATLLFLLLTLTVSMVYGQITSVEVINKSRCDIETQGFCDQDALCVTPADPVDLQTDESTFLSASGCVCTGQGMSLGVICSVKIQFLLGSNPSYGVDVDNCSSFSNYVPITDSLCFQSGGGFIVSQNTISGWQVVVSD